MSARGAVAAGHPLTAEAGARVLREGGNAIDAAVAAVLTSFVTESPLTGLGAGGFMLVHDPEREDVLLDFFVEVPGRTVGERRSDLDPILTHQPEAAAIYAPDGRMLREGDRFRFPDLGDALDRYGAEGPEPFYRGELAKRVSEWVVERGGTLGADDLAAYRPEVREPVSARYRGRDVLTNPPPSSGGILIAFALALLDRAASADVVTVVAAMEEAQVARTEAFFHGLYEEGFAGEFLAEER